MRALLRIRVAELDRAATLAALARQHEELRDAYERLRSTQAQLRGVATEFCGTAAGARSPSIPAPRRPVEPAARSKAATPLKRGRFAL